jgi:hypothetical protein
MIAGDSGIGSVADGYATLESNREGYMFVIGKGKSATTVTAPDVIMPKGNGIVIKGTVLDMSPAQPNTPCVSKESMSTQMEYLHKQMPIDGLWHNETITGVPVTLTAIDDNGTVFDLGTAITNGYYGTFSKEWTPPAEGKYQIVAYFIGDGSYSSSGAATAISVGSAAEKITIPEQITPPDYTMTIVGVGIAVIAAVIITVAITTILLYRKK